MPTSLALSAARPASRFVCGVVCEIKTFAGIGPFGIGQFTASFCIPTRNSFPSARQYFAIPENCSRCDRMYTLAPTPTFALIRMHAPWAERFSIRAATDRSVPALSSHDASTNIITAVRGSGAAPLIPSSIGNLNEQFNDHPKPQSQLGTLIFSYLSSGLS
jgi:hypothetical protein